MLRSSLTCSGRCRSSAVPRSTVHHASKLRSPRGVACMAAGAAAHLEGPHLRRQHMRVAVGVPIVGPLRLPSRCAALRCKPSQASGVWRQRCAGSRSRSGSERRRRRALSKAASQPCHGGLPPARELLLLQPRSCERAERVEGTLYTRLSDCGMQVHACIDAPRGACMHACRWRWQAATCSAVPTMWRVPALHADCGNNPNTTKIVVNLRADFTGGALRCAACWSVSWMLAGS